MEENLRYWKVIVMILQIIYLDYKHKIQGIQVSIIFHILNLKRFLNNIMLRSVTWHINLHYSKAIKIIYHQAMKINKAIRMIQKLMQYKNLSNLKFKEKTYNSFRHKQGSKANRLSYIRALMELGQTMDQIEIKDLY